MPKETQTQIKAERDYLRRTAKTELAPRWIADMETMELSERQTDGSYAPAYRMAPLKD